MTQAYPLHWPEGWPRTKTPQQSKFKTTLPSAISHVEDSLRKFAADSDRKVEGVVISSSYSLTDRNPREAGVAVYFSWDGISTCIAVDRYSKIEDNLYDLCVGEAMEGLDWLHEEGIAALCDAAARRAIALVKAATGLTDADLEALLAGKAWIPARMTPKATNAAS